MVEVVAGTCLWSLEQTVARFDGGALAGRVDVARPDAGACDLRLVGDRLGGEWLAVKRDDEPGVSKTPAPLGGRCWPLAVGESYIRGVDLVAAYQPAGDWPYSPQVYWRVGSLDSIPGVVGSLSVLISVQTHLLDTYPRIAVDSRTGTAEALRWTADKVQRDARIIDERDVTIQSSSGISCIIRRLSGNEHSYAEFMPASDFRAVHVQRNQNGDCRVTWELFAEFLEKGVIRRARVHGAFLRREDDVEAAAACCAAIEQESLPLTT